MWYYDTTVENIKCINAFRLRDETPVDSATAHLYQPPLRFETSDNEHENDGFAEAL